MAPLSGITVIEAANYVAGPYAGMILADLGATVIKVEPPRGDPYRRFGRVHGDSSLLFRASNQNKTSVRIDLKDPDGFSELLGLLADADVLLTNWRPSVASSLGLTEELVRSEFPRLVWMRVSGYGPTGPRSELPAYDNIIQARSGSALSAATDRPVNTNNNVADKVSAMFAAQAITAALFERERTGRGVIGDMPMVDAMAHFYAADISAGHRMVGREPDHEVAIPPANDSTFATADGHVNLAPVSGRQLRRALEAADCGDRFSDVMSAEPDQIFVKFSEIIAPALLTRPALEWEERFIDADVPAAAVRDFSQHLTDEQTVHNRTYEVVEDPTLGEWMVVRWPGLVDGRKLDVDTLAPPELPADQQG